MAGTHCTVLKNKEGEARERGRRGERERGERERGERTRRGKRGGEEGEERRERERRENKEGEERQRGEERERGERLGSRHRLVTGADLFLLKAHTFSLRCARLHATRLLKQNQREGQKKVEKKKD